MQNLSYVKLVSLLDGDAHVSVADVMVPNIASWFMLFVSSIVMWLGLKHQEASRSRWMVRLLRASPRCTSSAVAFSIAGHAFTSEISVQPNLQIRVICVYMLIGAWSEASRSSDTVLSSVFRHFT